MKRGRESEPLQAQEYLHSKHKVVKDRVRQALYRPEELTPEEERELFARKFCRNFGLFWSSFTFFA